MEPTIASLLPSKVRAWVYALLAAAAPAYGVVAANTSLPLWAHAVYASLTGAGFGLALSNTRSAGAADGEDYSSVDATTVAHLAAIWADEGDAEDEEPSEPVTVGFGSVL